jgi:hypothetical protein
MNITQHDFRKIRSCLKDHDIDKVVERSAYSKMTIYNVLKGDSIDRTTRIVVATCLEIIKENELEARKTVESISKKLK